MSNKSTNLSEYEAIAKTVQHYIDGAKAGRGAEMKPAFHQTTSFISITKAYTGWLRQARHAGSCE